ncbi:hypothetical protein [Sphingomonas koreensis]
MPEAARAIIQRQVAIRAGLCTRRIAVRRNRGTGAIRSGADRVNHAMNGLHDSLDRYRLPGWTLTRSSGLWLIRPGVVCSKSSMNWTARRCSICTCGW